MWGGGASLASKVSGIEHVPRRTPRVHHGLGIPGALAQVLPVRSARRIGDELSRGQLIADTNENAVSCVCKSDDGASLAAFMGHLRGRIDEHVA